MSVARREYLAFALVGGIGFLVDAGLLTWLIKIQDWGLYSSRILSFSVAVTVTWYLNRRFTFTKNAGPRRGREYGRYFIVQIIGALINLGVYMFAIVIDPALGNTPIIPLALGSAVAMIFNFFGAKFFAFHNVECSQNLLGQRCSGLAGQSPGAATIHQQGDRQGDEL